MFVDVAVGFVIFDVVEVFFVAIFVAVVVVVYDVIDVDVVVIRSLTRVDGYCGMEENSLLDFE